MLNYNFDFNDAPTQFEHQPKTQREIDENRKNPVEAFGAEMAVHGLYPDKINADGEMHRFKTGDRSDKSGYYVLHVSNYSHGYFGDFADPKLNNGLLWNSVTKHDVSSKEWQQYEQEVLADKKRLKKEKNRRHKTGQEKVQKKWESAKEADPDHPYLKKKQVGSYGGLRQGYGKALLLPMYDNKGILWSVQNIYDDGKKKRFEKDCKIQGCSFTIPGNDSLYLCEGYATGATIHEATGGTVIVAFDSGNLPNVAQQITKPFTICADNDDSGVGMGAAQKAQRATKELCNIVMPTFKESGMGTDFNDLFATEGIDVVKTQLDDCIVKKDYQPWTEQQTDASSLLSVIPPSREFIATCKGMDFIPQGIVGVITAPGGTGKSFTLAQLAYMFATNTDFAPFKAKRKFKTLFVAGEDDLDELKRRFYNICKGKPLAKNLLYFGSVFGELGPLMKLDRGQPDITKAYEWLEDTIQLHEGLEVLIIDPKSRFYGLDENNSDHATQWIQRIEQLSKKYQLTVLLSHHTSKVGSSEISQNMSRGSSALVDACRWQAGMVRLDKDRAKKFNIDKPRLYVELDIPKSNYASDMEESIFFKRNKFGVLKYVDIRSEGLKDIAMELFEMLKWDPIEYSVRELEKGDCAENFRKELKEKCPGFTRDKMQDLVKILIKKELIREEFGGKSGGLGRSKKVLRVVGKRPF